jgi:hypothetical protein
MKKLFFLLLVIYAATGCKSSKPESKYDFSNVQSISNEGMQPTSKLCGEPVEMPELTVSRQHPLDN